MASAQPQPTAQADVLGTLDTMGRLMRQSIDDTSGEVTTTTSVSLALNEAIGFMNTYMTDLFKQHNQTTQFLTYANQLWKLESYIGNKLNSDYMTTANGGKTMSTTIYVVRQRYMDKVSKIFYRTWTAMVLRRTLLVVLIAAALMAMSSTGLIDNTILVVALVALVVYYIVWFYYQIDSNARRDPTDPAVFNFDYANSSTDSANSCNNNNNSGIGGVPSYPPSYGTS